MSERPQNVAENLLTPEELALINGYLLQHPDEARELLSRIASHASLQAEAVAVAGEAEEPGNEVFPEAAVEKTAEVQDKIGEMLASSFFEKDESSRRVLESAQVNAESIELAKKILAEFEDINQHLPTNSEEMNPFAEKVCEWSRKVHTFLSSPEFFNDPKNELDSNFLAKRKEFCAMVHKEYENQKVGYERNPRNNGKSFESEEIFLAEKIFKGGDLFGSGFADAYSAWLKNKETPICFYAPRAGQPFDDRTMFAESQEGDNFMRVKSVNAWGAEVELSDGRKRIVEHARVVTG
jgi:hypothetical protein